MKVGGYILSINTATVPIEVAFSDEDGLVCVEKSYRVTSTSVELFKMISNLMEFKGISNSDIKALALTIGPGSFTGIRIGFAFTKGFAYALDLPVIPITSLHSIALSNPIPERLVTPVIPARRGYFFACLFRYRGYTLEKLTDESIYTFDDIKRFSKSSIILSNSNLDLDIDYIKINSTIEAVSEYAWRMFREGKVSKIWEVKPLYIRPSDAEEKSGIRVS